MDKISHPEQFAEAVLQSMGLAYPQRDALCWADEDVRLRVAEQLEQGIRHCILSSNPMTFERCHFSVSYSQLALDKAFMSLKKYCIKWKKKKKNPSTMCMYREEITRTSPASFCRVCTPASAQSIFFSKLSPSGHLLLYATVLKT